MAKSMTNWQHIVIKFFCCFGVFLTWAVGTILILYLISIGGDFVVAGAVPALVLIPICWKIGGWIDDA